MPAVFALLPNKTEETYGRLWEQLKQLEPNLAPESIMTDFEPAAINSSSIQFPNSRNRGCLFHFEQCLYRSVQAHGLKRQYDTNAEFALKIRMLSALAYVPVPDVVEAFNELTDNIQYPGEAQPVIDYFEDTWIGRADRRNRRRPPRFAHALWNVFDAVEEDLPKTNNACEGWHNGFQALVDGHHPSIWRFFNALKLQQSRNSKVDFLMR